MENQGQDKPKKSLRQLLEEVMAHDAGMMAFDPEVLQGEIEMKTDDYKSAIDRFEAESARISKLIEPLEKMRVHFQKTADRITDLMCMNMTNAGLTELPGQVWRANIQQKKSLVLTPDYQNPNSAHYMMFPDLLNRNYSWDKKALGEAAKKDPAKFQAVCYEKSTPFVRFYSATKTKRS